MQQQLEGNGLWRLLSVDQGLDCWLWLWGWALTHLTTSVGDFGGEGVQDSPSALQCAASAVDYLELKALETLQAEKKLVPPIAT